MTQETITFNIVNNTNGIVPISILGNPENPMDNANATTQYAWNVTSLTFGTLNSIILQYKGIFQSTFSVAQLTFVTQSYQAICDALNTLNIGSFFVTTSGGSTFINNYNQNIVFGNLEIFDNLFGTYTFTNYTTANPLFSQLGFVQIQPPALPTTTNINAGDGAIIFQSWDGVIIFPTLLDVAFQIVTNVVGTANSYLEVFKNGASIYSNFGTNFLVGAYSITPPDQYVINWYDVAP